MQKQMFLSFTEGELYALVNDAVKEAIKDFQKDKKDENDKLLTREEAATLLKIDLSTLHAWTKKGDLISYAKGSRRYYKKDEIINSLVELKP
ncbi:MAG: helix-turn-helix domain-containing protein [Oceanospirillaceae bacterium]|nr:helix-turn-helix domain-containing protein [Oceanospirillaceae bacterium]